MSKYFLHLLIITASLKISMDLSFDRLEHDLESGDLDTSAGGTCACADDHEGEEQESCN